MTIIPAIFAKDLFPEHRLCYNVDREQCAYRLLCGAGRLIFLTADTDHLPGSTVPGSNDIKEVDYGSHHHVATDWLWQR